MIIYIDMDDVLCDFSGAKKRALELFPGIKYPQSQYGFFEKLAPLKGAIDAIKTLIDSDRCDPYILTAPSTRNPLCYTEKRVWVEKKFGYDFVSKLIICSNKGLLKGDILIDDHMNGKGQENFEGRLIHFGSRQYPDWKAVMQELDIK